MNSLRLLRVINCGSSLVRYADGLLVQDLLTDLIKSGKSSCDALLLLQHHPVYTIGKRGKQEDFRVPIEEVRRATDIHVAPRGGEVTFHGPGQLVAYPIIRLRAASMGARVFVESLEDSVIATLGGYGIRAHGRLQGATGVWVEDRKIAAVGVKISHGVSSHGLALNISTDLSNFDRIVPCGIEDKAVTSMALELSRSERQQQQQQQQQDLGHQQHPKHYQNQRQGVGLNHASTASQPSQQQGSATSVGREPVALTHTGKGHVLSYVPQPDCSSDDACESGSSSGVPFGSLSSDRVLSFQGVAEAFVESFSRRFNYGPSCVEHMSVDGSGAALMECVKSLELR